VDLFSISGLFFRGRFFRGPYFLNSKSGTYDPRLNSKNIHNVYVLCSAAFKVWGGLK